MWAVQYVHELSRLATNDSRYLKCSLSEARSSRITALLSLKRYSAAQGVWRYSLSVWGRNPIREM